MLSLKRKVGERIRIGDDIEVVVTAIEGDRVRIGIQAPITVPVHREEVYRQIAVQRGIKPNEEAAA